MDLSLTSLTFRDFVPESLRNDYLEGKCKEIGKLHIGNGIFYKKKHLEIKSNKGIHYADRSILMYSSGYLGKCTLKRNKLSI